VKYNIKIRRISNLNKAKIDDEHLIYVGRGSKYITESPLANPFHTKGSFGKELYTLERSLHLYRIYLHEAIKARHKEYAELIRILELTDLHDVTLVCYCINSDSISDDLDIHCHAQIIRKALVYLDKVLSS